MTWWTRFNSSPATYNHYVRAVLYDYNTGGVRYFYATPNPFFPKMPSTCKNPLSILSCLVVVAVLLLPSPSNGRKTLGRRLPTSLYDGSPVFLWPLPRYLTNGNQTLSVDPNLALAVDGPGGSSSIVSDAFERYRDLIFKPWARSGSRDSAAYDVSKLTISVASDNETVGPVFDSSWFWLSVSFFFLVDWARVLMGVWFGIYNSAAIRCGRELCALRGRRSESLDRWWSNN